MSKFNISSSHKKYRKIEPGISDLIKKLLVFTKKGDFFVSVYLIDDLTMKGLNKKYRGKNKPTNVLSFNQNPEFINPPKLAKNLGELFLAPDYIKKHKEDIVYLTIHGFLHLLGFDHVKKNDTITMQRKEEQIIRKLIK